MSKPTGRPVGRPSKYSDDIAERIFEEMASGKDLVEICMADDMPNRATVYRWQVDRPEFAALYARAREALADFEFYRAKKLADECSEENVNSARVKLNHLQWRIMKVSPKNYGDKTRSEITGADGGPIEMQATTVDARQLEPEHREALKQALLAAKGSV